MDNERPVVRFMAQHWPITLITGYALYTRLNSRRKAKTLSAFTALTDTGIALSPLAAIALISLASVAKKGPSSLPAGIQQLPTQPAVNGFAGPVPPPQFFATRPPHETNAHIPAPAEEIITAAGGPKSPAGGNGMFDSFLS